MSARIIIGDALTELARLPAGGVHCCVTSPPYYGLRDYGVEGQLGLEATPDAYVAAMVGVFREVRRVLRTDGTLWLNIGDSYASQQSNNGGYSAKSTLAGFTNPNTKGRRANDAAAPHRIDHGAKAKDLLGIPWMLAFALRADGWYLRQDLIWAKPNPMPESVTDRCTKAHEYLFLLSKSERYHYDAAAIQETSITGDPRRPYTSEGAWALDGRPPEQRHGGEPRALGAKGKETPGEVLSSAGARMGRGAGWRDDPANAPLTRNKRSVWTIATAPFPEAHFATFPPALVEPCVLAGTSEKGVCPSCGEPWVRQTTRTFVPQQDVSEPRGIRCAEGQKPMDASSGWPGVPRGTTTAATTGWSPSCRCPTAAPVPATVLDPFLGAGTTALVADRLGRSAIGIELNPAYAEMARARIAADAGLFFEAAE